LTVVRRAGSCGPGADYIPWMSRYRPVLSEVGYKATTCSARLTPVDWVDALREDLNAGVYLVITEARESGRSGFAQADGHLRTDILDAVLGYVDADCGRTDPQLPADPPVHRPPARPHCRC